MKKEKRIKEKSVRGKRILHGPLCLFLVLILTLLLCVPSMAAVNPTVGAATISAKGYKPGTVRVKCSIPGTVRCTDKKYYLFEVDAYSNDLVQPIKAAKRSKSLTFDLALEENPAYPQLKYALAVKTGDGTSASSYTRISPAVFVTKPEKCAPVQSTYVYPSTKKGIQSGDFDVQKETGSKNCFVNIVVSTLLNNPNIEYTYNGKTYHFNSFWGLQVLVKNCNALGISVTAQVMLDASAPASYRAVSGGSGPFYAFNVKDRASREAVDALFAHLARFFCREDCYISNWILGNEVNSTTPYYYMGNVSLDTFAETYAYTFRSFYNALRGARSSTRVFICLEHCWTIPNGYAVCFPGKSFLAAFDKAIDRLQKSVAWNLAYHPYPDQLKDPAFWNDAVSNTANATSITPKNLTAFTKYIKSTYGKKTRIIISEIGFNSKAGEDVQAAALALAYFKAACDPMVDAFIIRSYADEAGDAAYGLTFGIKGKKAFNVFKYMDTSSYSKYTKTLLKNVVGSSWKSSVPGFKASRLRTHYH